MNQVALSTRRYKRQTHHILTGIRGIEYFQRIVNIRGNLVRPVSRIRAFAFTTQPGLTPSIGHSVPHSHELRARHRRENRHNWSQIKFYSTYTYIETYGSWLVQKSKSAMIGFLSPQSLNWRDEVFDWSRVSDNIRTRDVDGSRMRFETRSTNNSEESQSMS